MKDFGETGASGRAGIGTVAGFRAALAAVDVLGWESQPAADLLWYARHCVVQRVVAARRLYGDGLDDATSAGWFAAWEALRWPGIRTSSSPWGSVRLAVIRAVQGAFVARIYKASPRTAWRRFAAAVAPEPDAAASSISLERELEKGHDFPCPPTTIGLGQRLESICAALVEAGWERQLAEDALAWVASNYSGLSHGSRTATAHSMSRARTRAGELVDAAVAVGDPAGHPDLRCPCCEARVVAGSARAAREVGGTWPFFRLMSGQSHTRGCEYAPCGAVRGPKFAAVQLRMPEWQLRRLALVVGGGRRHVGLLELMTLQGQDLLQHDVVRQSIRATTLRRLPCPSTVLGAQYGAGHRSPQAAA